MSNIRTADQVAELYGVAKSTVHRWVKNGNFKKAPTIVPSPSGGRDRVLFDVEDVAEEFEEIVRSLPSLSGDKPTLARLDAFRRG